MRELLSLIMKEVWSRGEKTLLRNRVGGQKGTNGLEDSSDRPGEGTTNKIDTHVHPVSILSNSKTINYSRDET